MISDNLKRTAYAQETDVAIITLLTLTSDEISEPVRVCNVPLIKFSDIGVYGVESNGQRYIFLPFEIELPQDDKTGAVYAKLKIDNIDRRIVLYARESKKPISVDISCVLSNNVNYVELDYSGFKFTNVKYDGFSVTGNLSLDYLGLEPFPCGRFTPSGFPGLF